MSIKTWRYFLKKLMRIFYIILSEFRGKIKATGLHKINAGKRGWIWKSYFYALQAFWLYYPLLPVAVKVRTATATSPKLRASCNQTARIPKHKKHLLKIQVKNISCLLLRNRKHKRSRRIYCFSDRWRSIWTCTGRALQRWGFELERWKQPCCLWMR